MARFAFVTDEYPQFSPAAGGLASYLGRMAKLLVAQGHEVHVFVPGQANQTLNDEGVGLHVVSRASSAASLGIRVVRKIPWIQWRRIDDLIYQLGISHQLAAALRRYESAHGHFDIVQSCDLWFRGLFVDASRRPHVVRCSWA